ncbi:Lysozyme M1 precursor [Botrimarina hoheduenensis]|uniref:Lysozyme M1 n=1 Tax=Botrimarina hoheduenensis TaxID=2528000 RepID=A0A5C5WC54_9BACT|nr:Lysozyme M1 precursor [Botrimarina hoheduenensis]
MLFRHRSVSFAATLLMAAVTGPACADLLGVDVSTHQGTVNWNSMKNAGVGFAFTKATEGVDFIDTRFTQNMAGARAAGIPIGPYHFARPDSSVGTLSDPIKQDAVNEANDFVDAIQPFYNTNPEAYLRPVLDVEKLPLTAEINTVSEQRQYLSDWINDFADVLMNRLGVHPIIYLNSNYAINYVNSSVAQYDLWIARWTYNTSNLPAGANQLGVWSDWDFWQWSDSESIGGEAPVDANLFRGTTQDLAAYLYAAEPPLTGDYNGDGVVDLADYTKWRDTLRRGNLDLSADGNKSGAIDTGDYDVWAANYGATAPPATAIPEPTAALLAALALATVCLRVRP